jgi:hypothetical protein
MTVVAAVVVEFNIVLYAVVTVGIRWCKGNAIVENDFYSGRNACQRYGIPRACVKGIGPRAARYAGERHRYACQFNIPWATAILGREIVGKQQRTGKGDGAVSNLPRSEVRGITCL